MIKLKSVVCRNLYEIKLQFCCLRKSMCDTIETLLYTVINTGCARKYTDLVDPSDKSIDLTKMTFETYLDR